MRVYLFLSFIGLAGFILISCSNRADGPLIRTSVPKAGAPFEQADAKDRQAMLERLQQEALAAQPPSAPPSPQPGAAVTRPLADLPEGEPRVLAELPVGRPGLIQGVLPK